MGKLRLCSQTAACVIYSAMPGPFRFVVARSGAAFRFFCDALKLAKNVTTVSYLITLNIYDAHDSILLPVP